MASKVDYSDPTASRPVPGFDTFYPLTEPSSGSALVDFKNAPPAKSLPKLFTPVTIGPVTFKNRIFVSPMCQYSCETGTGLATPWHLVHLGSFAVKGAALVMTEAASVSENGRISPEDLGIWNDEQRDALKPIVDFIHAQGAKAGIQLAHAGRKASTLTPWIAVPVDGPRLKERKARPNVGGWEDVWAPSAVSFQPGSFPDPVEMSLQDIETFKNDWTKAVERSVDLGFDESSLRSPPPRCQAYILLVHVIEIHAAHGYLLHEFLSPLSNKRTDQYGGSLENRNRLLLEVVEITRKTFKGALFLRISATDWYKEGEKDAQGTYVSWDVEQAIVLQREATKRGVDLVDVSSGGLILDQQITVGPGYQVPFAEQLAKARDPGMPKAVSVVGMITNGKQAEEILQKDQADAIMIAREFLRDSELVFNWAMDLGVVVKVPVQYDRAYVKMYFPGHPGQ